MLVPGVNGQETTDRLLSGNNQLMDTEYYRREPEIISML